MIKITDWSKHQSYKDRRPPWIRFHRTILDNFEYQSMSADSRALLPMLWLLACEYEDPKAGIIELSVEKIAFRLRRPPAEISASLSELQVSDFIECNESVTKAYPIRNETVPPETEAEAETEAETTLSSKHDDAAQILNYLNSKRASDYKPTKSNIGLITARLNEGFSTEDIIRVIDNKIIEWGGSRKMEKYIRPSTLFNATKFSQYAGEPAQDAEDDFSWAMTREEAKAAKAANGPNVIDGDFKHA